MPKRPTERALLEDLPDGAARRAIRHDLSTTILVEAAAGTGKTASLVGRMVALVATDATTVDKLSAVTFTIRLDAGPTRLQTWLTAADGTARGAYFVEVKYVQ